MIKTDNKILAFIWEIAEVVILSLVIVLPIRYFLIQPFFVKGASMEPNFEDGEYLIINEISYRFGEPKRGDVVVFKYPVDPSQFYIKRVIGLPGEKVEVKGGYVYIFNKFYPDGWKVAEAYLPAGRLTYGDTEMTLGTDEYFVMGDNRAVSYDSRRWGVLPEKNIIGKVALRAWPIPEASIIQSPAY